jgi:hypothetical protein
LLDATIVVLLVFLPLWLIPRTSTDPLWTAGADEPVDAQEDARWYAVASRTRSMPSPTSCGSLAALAPGARRRKPVLRRRGGLRGGRLPQGAAIINPFDQRFGTAGRSISLINSPATTLAAPIASVTSLQHTLAHIGRS